MRDTYCQLGEILSVHFNGVHKIMLSIKIFPVKMKKKIECVEVQTSLLCLGDCPSTGSGILNFIKWH